MNNITMITMTTAPATAAASIVASIGGPVVVVETDADVTFVVSVIDAVVAEMSMVVVEAVVVVVVTFNGVPIK
jgi:hypothetical protein